MRLQPVDVVLGDQRWTVRPLTLAQVQALEPLVFGSAEAKAGSMAAAIGILRVALSRDHKAAADRLEEVEAPATEIARAMAGVLRLGGFLPSADVSSADVSGANLPSGDHQPGEAEAGAPPASIGAASTQG